MIIYIAIFALFILAEFVYLYYSYNKSSFSKDDWSAAIDVVNKIMQEQYAQISKDRQSEQEKQLEKIKQEIDLKKTQYETELTNLQEEVNNAKNRRTEQLQQLAQSLTLEINEKSKEKALQLSSITEYYEQQKTNIVNEYNNFIDEINDKKSELTHQLRQAEARQLEIIEEYKRAEKIKQDKDFYRIVLSEDALEDVKKLRKIASELHNPTVLYKLIYKEYYERPFNEMIGRVVTGRGSVGIYKITSLENGRVYIGQTRQNFKDRLRSHVKRGVKAEIGTQNKLYTAMWEDGVENFTFEILAECTISELNEKEKEYIALYHADTWGYNSTAGGA